MRDSCVIEQPKRRTTKFIVISFSYIDAKVWNELPPFKGNDWSEWLEIPTGYMEYTRSFRHSILLFMIQYVLMSSKIALYWVTHLYFATHM